MFEIHGDVTVQEPAKAIILPMALSALQTLDVQAILHSQEWRNGSLERTSF
ncbi:MULTISPECIES: hypothetical protein [unclassified Mesorhizobium]|uniref:hypothetical protein n=1 Tax=unclassified Mesorhizobium TaxID=325217 RepID=UPI0016764318|nr:MULTISPECIES: hypothetical protein [unclassified Mesorhizobium]